MGGLGFLEVSSVPVPAEQTVHTVVVPWRAHMDNIAIVVSVPCVQHLGHRKSVVSSLPGYEQQ